MNKSFENNNSESDAGAGQTILALGTTKPQLNLNQNAKILGCNNSFEKLIHVSKEQFLATDLTSFPQNKQFIEAIKIAAVEGVNVFKGVVIFGNDISVANLDCVLFSVTPGNQQEKVIACFILDSDFTALEVNTDRLNSVSGRPGYLYASVSVHAADGSAVFISPSIESLLGYSCAELMKMDPFYPVYPEDVPIVANVIKKLNSGQNQLNARYRMIHKNGSVISVETSSYLINDATGEGKHIVNVTWDLGSFAKIEHALALSEQKYYRLVMNLPVGVSLISASGQILEANDAMKKIMGLPLDVKISELSFFSIEVMKRVGINPKLRQCIEKKEIVYGEIKLKSTRNIPEIFLVYSFLPVLNHTGDIDTIIGYVSDLSQQKKAESESSTQADFLKLVINAIKTPFFVKDEDHKWVMLNDAAVEMMGHTQDDLLGKSDYDLYPKEQASVFWQCDELVFKKGSFSNEEVITWSDGTIHTIVTHKQLYIEKFSGKKFIVGTIHDITGYKKIEDELRASVFKYHELFDNANDFIITLEPDGKITNANRKLLRYLQTDLQSLTKKNVFDFFSGENKVHAYSMRDLVLSDSSDNMFEIEAIGAAGQPVIYEVKASLIRQKGEIIGVQCVFSDVTERKEASLKLEEYNKNLLELNNTKDKFFSIIAHDLRNPYSSILGFSELLFEDLDDLSKDEIRDSIKIIHDSAKNSLNLLENLLAWSRLETGRIPFDLVKVILTDVVDEVIDVLFSLAYRKKIEIVNSVEPSVLLFADKNMLITIFNNLIMNAIKYTPIGGKIHISTGEPSLFNDSDKEFIKIMVADTGVGMDEKLVESLFDLNKTQSNPGTENEQGTGLGLVLSREMVEKHGGSIMVESSPGKGSVFSFYIPLFKPDAEMP